MSHTPGPWYFDPEVEPEDLKKARLEIVDESFISVIATVTNSEDKINEDFANGKLLAAAPELLQALKCALADLEGSLQVHEENNWHAHDWKAHQQSIDEARKAIAKAEGERQ